MRKLSICASLVLFVSASANAQIIYAVNNLNGGAGGNEALISFAPGNPAGFSTIGTLGVAGALFSGLDFGLVGPNYNLYAYRAAQGGVAAGGLYQINTATGAATAVGNSTQSLQDLCWSPLTNTMYGIQSVANVASLHSVNLTTGVVSLVGNVTGLPATNVEVGCAVDSLGFIWLHDLASDDIYKSNVPNGLAVASVIAHPEDANFSQGMTIDWSGAVGPLNRGYHAAIGNAPAFFSRLYRFEAVGAPAYTLVGNFSPDGVFPAVEAGDVAIRPIPEPTTLSLLALGSLMLIRRRK